MYLWLGIEPNFQLPCRGVLTNRLRRGGWMVRFYYTHNQESLTSSNGFPNTFGLLDSGFSCLWSPSHMAGITPVLIYITPCLTTGVILSHPKEHPSMFQERVGVIETPSIAWKAIILAVRRYPHINIILPRGGHNVKPRFYD